MPQAGAELQTRFIAHMNISECIFLKVKQGRVQGLVLRTHVPFNKRIRTWILVTNICVNNFFIYKSFRILSIIYYLVMEKKLICAVT